MKPQRVWQRRVKGWRMPANTVSVTRGKGRKWGNPFPAYPSIEQSLKSYRLYAEDKAKCDPDWLEPLRGKNLACFCVPESPCHADILLELANR